MVEADEKAIYKYYAAILGRTIFTEDEKREQKETLKKSLSEDVTSTEVFCRWLKEACEHRDGEKLDLVMLLGWIFELFSKDNVKIIEGISLENWVKSNNLEDMVGLIERYGGEEKVKSLALMAIQKYPDHYLGDNDEYVARKAMWALHRLYKGEGNEEAIEKIKELSKCGDLMVEDFAKHHLEKLGVKYSTNWNLTQRLEV